MPMFNFRVFLSYRGESAGTTIGKEFAAKLFRYLKEDPLWNERYGEIYYSPITKEVDVNFKKDAGNIMSTVEYFVMPLTKDYYADFWDEENDCPNPHSVTYKEIQAAIENQCRFVCISFPDFVSDAALIRKLFGDAADDLLCVAPLPYDPSKEEELFQEIARVIKKPQPLGMATLLKALTPNVCLSFKRETENKIKYPFYEKLNDVTKITLLNFAASSFISGIEIASTYQESDTLKNWFDYNLANGHIEANIILVNPHSYAAHDAAMCKMYPSGKNVKKDEIILTNMNKLFRFIQNYPHAKLNVFLTDIALPYGVMMTEHKDPANNHIKVDLYSPVINDDKKRPSFYMLQNDPQTEMLFTFFEDNVKDIMNNYSFRYLGHPDTKWLLRKSIIHRGRIRANLLPHTQEAYDACLDARHPIEADLLRLSDGTVVVGRQEEILVCNGVEKRLGDCTKRDLRTHNRNAGNKRVLLLEEFLEYIGGKVPVLLEIKSDHTGNTKAQKEYVNQILKIVQNYFKQNSYRNTAVNKEIVSHELAFHSADPRILKMIKDTDCMIPCGLITMDFAAIQDQVGEEFCRVHKEKTYLEFFSPDFISVNVDDLDTTLARLCEERQIPLLGWTVKDGDAQQQALDDGCDNIIIEGSKSYL